MELGEVFRLIKRILDDVDRRPLEDGKAIAKDVWQQLRSQAGESGAFSGIRETMERIMGRLKVGTVFCVVERSRDFRVD